MDSTLQIFPRRVSGTPVSQISGCYTLHGELSWLLRGPKDAIDSAAKTLASVGERVADDVLILDFGNAVGFFDVPGLGRIEVVSGKWDRAAFDKMLSELTEIASALPFSAGSTAALPYDRSIAANEDLLYHMFVYLRWALSDRPVPENRLLSALKLVVHDPQKRFEQLRREVPLERVRNVDSLSLSRIIGSRGGFCTRVSRELTARNLLARSLSGLLPDRIDERQTQVTLDTPENRFVKLYLESVGGVIESMRRHIEDQSKKSVFSQRVLRDCAAMSQALAPIRQHPMWNDIGPMIHLPASSPVLQRRRGYREVYRHFSRMRLAARVPLEKQVIEDLLEAKDIAQLYEIWCYFVVAKELRELLGSPTRAGKPRVEPLQVSLPWDLEIIWPNNTRLLYNARYSRSRPKGHSYSVPLRPDISLEARIESETRLHLFDAKFKVDNVSAIMSSQDSENVDIVEDIEERKGVFKRGDLYKMHAYRDAIDRVESVWILFPGTEFRFFDTFGGPTVDPASLMARPIGVGAIPLVPNDVGDGRQSTLRHVLGKLLNVSPQLP